MHLETKNPRAFEYLRAAQLSLSKFQQLKNREQLEHANRKLGKAIEVDPNYLRALYYRGLVNDMLGQPRLAAADFELVLKQEPPFLTEVKYNLGVAIFHQYGPPNLELAIEYFKDVIKSTNDKALQLRARAGIAHAYAVMMIPNPPEEDAQDCEKVDTFLGSAVAKEQVSKYHNLSLTESERLKSELDKQKRLPSSIKEEIGWRWRNTCAVQHMFYTDYFSENRIERLHEAETKLSEADKISPDNWSINSNIGSTCMRLGYWLKVSSAVDCEQIEEYFKKAITRLDYVIDKLYPRYGFALYEKGRVYRLKGDFQKASEFLREAREVPARDRAVGDATLKCEKRRVAKQESDYPYLASLNPS